MKLVYIRTPRGYAPQKWPKDMPVHHTVIETAAEHELKPEEFGLPIAELTKLYPPPQG